MHIKVEPDVMAAVAVAVDTLAAVVVATMLAVVEGQALLVAQESRMDQQLQEHVEQ